MQVTRLKGAWVVISDGRVVARCTSQREAEEAKKKWEGDEAARADEHALWKEKNRAGNS